MTKTAYLLVNFGGPRNLGEIEEFLISLLTDQEVVRTPFPAFFHRWLFTRVAKKRTGKIAPDYAQIGGKSPIYEDTEAVAKNVSQILGEEVITFHRYLPKTHPGFIQKMEALSHVREIRIFPMFPQFSYATTGSIARWFKDHLSTKTLGKMQWVKSYPMQGSYIGAMEQCLRECLESNGLKEEETFLLFSAHGLPERFIATGDTYQRECCLSYEEISARFPKASSLISYQSQFGKEKWIEPYTAEVCEKIADLAQGKKNVVVVPLSFTSDHIETLYEIEELYLGAIRKNGLSAIRCPALNRRGDWIAAIAEIFKSKEMHNNQMLLRK